MIKHLHFNKIKYPYFFLMTLIVAAVLASISINGLDGDILWHYKLGEEIFKTRQISINDSFSWQKGITWIQQEWLYDVLLYLLISIGQMKGYILALFVMKAFLIYKGAQFAKADNRAAYLIYAAMLFFVIPSNMALRPAEISAWFTVLAIWMYRNLPDKRIWIWISFGILVGNFHGGSAFTTVILVAILTVLDIAYDVREKGKEAWNKGKLLLKVCPIFLFVAGTICSPGGVEMWHVGSSLSSYYSTQFIQEWKPWTFGYFQGFIVLLHVIAFGYACRKNGFAHKETVENVAVLCALFLATLVSRKAGTILLILTAVYEYPCLEQMFRDFAAVWNFRMPKFLKLVYEWRPGMLSASVCCAILLYFVFTSILYTGTFNEYANAGFSSRIIEYMKDLPEETEILHSYNAADVLIWNNVKVFVDPRQFPYTSEQGNGSLDDFLRIAYEKPTDLQGWGDFLAKYDFEYILTSKDFNAGWVLELLGGYTKILEDEDTGQILWKAV